MLFRSATFDNNWIDGLRMIELEAIGYFNLLPPTQAVLGHELFNWRVKFKVDNVWHYTWQPQMGVILVMTSDDYVTLTGTTPEVGIGSFQAV